MEFGGCKSGREGIRIKMGIAEQVYGEKADRKSIAEEVYGQSSSSSIAEQVYSASKGAAQFVSEYYDYLHQPTEKPTGAGDFIKRVVPESISKTAVGVAEFPFRVGYGVGDVIQKRGIKGQPLINPETGQPSTAGRVLDTLGGLGGEGAKNILGVARFVGEPIGLFGWEKFKEKWSTDPAGALLAVYPFVKAGTVSARVVKDYMVRNKPVAKAAHAPAAASKSVAEEVFSEAPTPEKGQQDLIKDKSFKLAEQPIPDEVPRGEFKPAPAEQPLLTGTEKAYKDVGMAEKPKGDAIVEQVDSLRSILPDFELGKKIWSQDSVKPEVLHGTSSTYPGWFKDVFPNDSAKQVMGTIDKWKKGGDAVLGKKESRIMASVRDLAKDAVERGDDIGESHWREQFAAGPGAKTIGTKGEAPADIAQLTQAVSSVSTPAQSLADRIGIAQSISTSFNKAKDTVSTQLERMKGISAALSDAIEKPSEFIEKKFAPQSSDYKGMLGDYLLSRTKTGIEATKFAKEINKVFPRERQEAMRKWYLADGDPTQIKAWADGTKDVRLKKMYEDALTLTPEEQRIARNIKQYHDAKLLEAQDAGVLASGVENYLRRIWKRENPITKSIMSEINAGMFRKNPSLLKKRFYDSEFAAEQVGLRQKDYQIGFSVTSYDIDLNEALATRAAIRKGFDGKASDGRPLFSVSGSGKPVVDEAGATSKYVIRPQTKPEAAFDYRIIDHPAMREWKWVTNDESGKPVLLQGGILVHPEIYPHLKNVLGKSAIMQSLIGKAALTGAREFKNTLLSLSGFHQVQVGVHAIFHKVNPFSAPEINLDVPAQSALVSRGLQVYSHRALTEFGEGLYSSGLINKLPGIGPISQKYGSYLFENYIPRQKMQMALAALERNTERYKGKLSTDQIYELTANQANAAFGELNYKWMGRNPTVQDSLRLMLLAPDFLEARGRFVGQAVKPWGREQGAALLRGAIGMYAAARIINQVVDGDPHWDKYFSVVVDGKEYSLRSIPGDMQHLFSDPRSFAYHRLNPTIAKPIVEYLSGRDAFGRERTFFQQVGDFFTQQAPIPMQGLVSGKERTLYQSVLSSIGVSSWKSRSSAEKLAGEFSSSNMPKGVLTDEQKEKMKVKSKIKQKFQEGDREGAKELAKQNGVDVSNLMRLQESAKHPLASSFKNLSPAQAARVWDKATPEERKDIRNAFYTKILNDKKMTREEKISYIRQIKDTK